MVTSIMPIYKYTCKTPADQATDTACGNEYEVLYTSQAKVIEEEASEACPVCGGTDKEREQVPTGTSFQLKGKGWFNSGGY